MAQESRLRMQQYIKHGCNVLDGKHPHSNPLGFWTEQDILSYLLTRKVSFASIYGKIKEKSDGQLYTTGINRTGCMFCMFGCHLEKEPNRFQKMEETHPQQYDYCMNKLGLSAVLDFIKVKYRTTEKQLNLFKE